MRRTILAIAALFAVTGCANSGGAASNPIMPTTASVNQAHVDAKIHVSASSLNFLAAVCAHKSRPRATCVAQSQSFAMQNVTVQESDGFSNFTYTTSDAKVATGASGGTNVMTVTAQGVGQATVTVHGDKGATASVVVEVTETDVHVIFTNVPSNAASMVIQGNNGGDSITANFLFPGPLHYVFVAYDLVIPFAASGSQGIVAVTLYDKNGGFVQDEDFEVHATLGTLNELKLNYAN